MIICNRLYNESTFQILTRYIRYQDNEIKIISLGILTNILFKSDNQILKSQVVDHLPVNWGLSILTNLLMELNDYKQKINCLKIMSK